MDYKVCSFFGHSETDFTDELKEKIIVKLTQMIENENYGVFYFGGMGQFDYGCWEIVTELKEKYPFIKTVLCLWEGKKPWWAKRRKYDEEKKLTLSFDYWYTRIYYRNAAMIDESDCCVFFVNRNERSGAYKAMNYAKNKKKPLVNFGILEI